MAKVGTRARETHRVVPNVGGLRKISFFAGAHQKTKIKATATGLPPSRRPKRWEAPGEPVDPLRKDMDLEGCIQRENQKLITMLYKEKQTCSDESPPQRGRARSKTKVNNPLNQSPHGAMTCKVMQKSQSRGAASLLEKEAYQENWHQFVHRLFSNLCTWPELEDLTCCGRST